MLYELEGIAPKLIGAGHFIADSADVIGQVELHDNSSVWFNVVIRGDKDLISIGARSNIQDGSVLHVDPGCPMHIAEGVTVGHKVMLHGCRIGANSLVGINSVILNNAVIGENCLIGANSLITEGKVIPPGSVVMGSPGKVVKQLTEAEIEILGLSAQHYVDNARLYSQGLKPIN